MGEIRELREKSKGRGQKAEGKAAGKRQQHAGNFEADFICA
jgi:hypothetical protein